MMQAFPDAKVILTIRDDAEVWHKSVLNSIYEGTQLLVVLVLM
jgi:Sulfotransferase domain